MNLNRAELVDVRHTVIALIEQADELDLPHAVNALADALLALNVAAELLAGADPLEPDVTVSVTKVP